MPRPEEFASSSLPPHVSVYTWPDCTLDELALELAASKPSVLPSPAVGTRLAFQLVCPDLRAGVVSSSQARYAVRDLGSLVVGQGGPGAEVEGEDADNVLGTARESNKTLSEAKFVVGDYISCAVLPPLADGSVAPVSSAKREVLSGARESRRGRGGLPGRDIGFVRGGGHGRVDWASGRDGGRDEFPMGEWRRGERLPEGPGPASRPRGRGRW